MSMSSGLRRFAYGLSKEEVEQLGQTATDLDTQFNAANNRIPALEKGDYGYAEAMSLRQHILDMRNKFMYQAYKNLSLSNIKKEAKDDSTSPQEDAQTALLGSARAIADLMNATAGKKDRHEIEDEVDAYRKKQVSALRYYGTKLLSFVLTLGGMIGGFFAGRLLAATQITPENAATKLAQALPIVGEVLGVYAGGKAGNWVASKFKSDAQLLVEKRMHLADNRTSASVEDEKLQTAYNHGARFMRKLTG